jgi:transcriptional regulator with XRE-family HTH domain
MAIRGFARNPPRVDRRLPSSVQIGQAIRKKRQEQVPELSIESLALAAGITTGYLSDIERQRRKQFSWEVLASIVEALGIDLSELIAEAEAMPAEANPK